MSSRASSEPDLGATPWDVVVVGAGVAGAMVAGELARLRRPARVLLVERAAWPRTKVCGCCLNAAAVGVLSRAGLGTLLEAGATRIEKLRVRVLGRHFDCAHRGLAIARDRLDHALVERAVAAGVEFADACSAVLVPPSSCDRDARTRRLTLRTRGGERVIESFCIIAADGLDGGLLRGHREFESLVDDTSWMGLGATIPSSAGPERTPDDPRRGPELGTIEMNVARRGYAGLVRLAGGEVNLAAAVDPHEVRSAGSPEAAVARILSESGSTVRAESLRFRGTPLLTRRRATLAMNRVFVLGDSAGYVEPFTGEGMAWALAGAEELGRLLAVTALTEAEELDQAGARWHQWHQRTVRRRQTICHAVRAAARAPRAVAAAIGVPGVAGLIAGGARLLSAQTGRAYAGSRSALEPRGIHARLAVSPGEAT